MEQKTMGTFLAALRRAKGMTQQEVADRLLVSNRAVSRWERDESAPDITLLPAIADLFGVTVDEILRGERKRAAEETPPESRAAAAPAPDPRALRGMRALCRRARSRFDTFLLVAVALVTAGYVVMLGVVYGLERVYIGFAGFCLCCVGSAVFSILAVRFMQDTLDEQAPDTTETRLPDADLVELVRVYTRGCYTAIAAPVCGMVLSLPLVLYKKGTYFDQAFMMDWKDYLLVAFLLAAVLAIAGWLCYRPFRIAVQSKWAAILGLSAPAGYVPEHKIILRRLNLRQWIAAMAGLGGGVLIDMLVMSVTTNENENGWPFVIMHAVVFGVTLAGVILPVIFLVRTYRRLDKSERAVRQNVLLSGLRNVIVSLETGSFWITGIAYVSAGAGDNFSPSLLWTPQAIAAWAGVTMALFGITEIIRRLWKSA